MVTFLQSVSYEGELSMVSFLQNDFHECKLPPQSGMARP